ncbi:hypothetical protein HK100_005315 [Physocladia obscura]|uniref:Uncharacterized protein n=1 Tax=Physocladia obscura TaxID=109957 RepID=A0AAD5STX0_9FUNG|nr:hypothetical protein HK100_005315 [Physocladia obscura]
MDIEQFQFEVTKYVEEANGEETATRINVSVPNSIAGSMLGYVGVGVGGVHVLRRINKRFNEFILDASFARLCLTRILGLSSSLSSPHSGSEFALLAARLDNLILDKNSNNSSNKRSSVLQMNSSVQSPLELFFVWPDTWKDVYTTLAAPTLTSFGKVIGPRLRRSTQKVPLYIPAQIGQMIALVTLDLAMSGLAGPIPDAVTELRALEFLNLGRNRLEGKIPSEIGNLVKLKHLDLQNNDLSGPIPQGIGHLLFMEKLYLNENKLDGSIPKEFGELVQLITLNLGKNNLEGVIPDEICGLTQLTTIFLDNNRLTGNIPTDIGKLVRLRSLYFNKNKLVGVIPESVGQLHALRQFVVNSNQLGGPIPTELQQLDKLEVCNLRNNVGFTCDFEFDFDF